MCAARRDRCPTHLPLRPPRPAAVLREYTVTRVTAQPGDTAAPGGWARPAPLHTATTIKHIVSFEIFTVRIVFLRYSEPCFIKSVCGSSGHKQPGRNYSEVSINAEKALYKTELHRVACATPAARLGLNQCLFNIMLDWPPDKSNKMPNLRIVAICIFDFFYYLELVNSTACLF